MPPTPTVDLGQLGFDRGGHLLVDRTLRGVEVGQTVVVSGSDPHLAFHLAAWARKAGHRLDGSTLTRGSVQDQRWSGAVRAGSPAPGGIVEVAPASWGLAARGALIEAGGPELAADLDSRTSVWAPTAARLYAQAVANQWDPATAIAWDTPFDIPDDIEAAVVQVMTYLVENEQAALVVPARFIPRVHPHYREVLQLLAVQVADEARHVEVF
ncbi:MAG: ferritin-like domain-containing protein, partial [Acidimicrobiales bacterium]